MHFNIKPNNPTGVVVTIKRMLLIPTRTDYQDMYTRSFTLNCNNDILTKVGAITDEVYSTNVNGVINAVQLANRVPEVIDIASSVSGNAIIPYGWKQERLRFLMETEHYIGNVKYSTYYQGFTDYYDASSRGYIDPKMKFYINSVVTVTRVMDPVRKVYNSNIHSNFNVIRDCSGETTYEEIDNNAIRTIRPKDIFHNITLNSETQRDDTERVSFANIINPRTSITSRRSNNNMLSYMAKTLDIYNNSRATSDMTFDATDIYRNSQAIAQEEDITRNPFINKLIGITGNYSGAEFSIHDLTQIDPGAQSAIHLISKSDTYYSSLGNSMLDGSNTASTLQPTIYNMKSTIIGTMLPTFMSEHMITKLAINISAGATPEPIINVTYVNSFIDGIDLTKAVNTILAHVKAIMIPKLTALNTCQIEAIIDADLLGDISIMLSINGGEHVLYRFPTFADSLYTPMRTSTESSKIISNDFTTFMEHLPTGNMIMNNAYEEYSSVGRFY